MRTLVFLILSWALSGAVTAEQAFEADDRLAARAAKNAEDNVQMILSVSPALIAWFATFTDRMINLSMLYITFAGLCFIDNLATHKGYLPSWYPRLRVPLTAIVVVSLINAQLALALG